MENIILFTLKEFINEYGGQWELLYDKNIEFNTLGFAEFYSRNKMKFIPATYRGEFLKV